MAKLIIFISILFCVLGALSTFHTKMYSQIIVFGNIGVMVIIVQLMITPFISDQSIIPRSMSKDYKLADILSCIAIILTLILGLSMMCKINAQVGYLMMGFVAMHYALFILKRKIRQCMLQN